MDKSDNERCALSAAGRSCAQKDGDVRKPAETNLAATGDAPDDWDWETIIKQHRAAGPEKPRHITPEEARKGKETWERMSREAENRPASDFTGILDLHERAAAMYRAYQTGRLCLFDREILALIDGLAGTFEGWELYRLAYAPREVTPKPRRRRKPTSARRRR